MSDDEKSACAGYRTNAKQTEEEQIETLWRRVARYVERRRWRHILTFTLVVGLVAFVSSYLMIRSGAPRVVPCRETSEIIAFTGTNNEHTCRENQRMDTTRLREGDHTYVLVRCWCSDHGESMKEETP